MSHYHRSLVLGAALPGWSIGGLGVYCAVPSMIVSKLIGETEKYLASLLAQAEGKDWVLFFDKADALFGKRTQVSGAQVRYGAQALTYILKRVEGFTGIVVLAGNLKGNIDGAFGV